MKQHITLSQLNVLSEEGKRRYWAYSKNRGWRRPDSDYDLWSIGQMIEFLDEKRKGKWFLHTQDRILYWGENNEYSYDYYDSELCDALWQAVKEILEHDREN
jgi:hypothetical protein